MEKEEERREGGGGDELFSPLYQERTEGRGPAGTRAGAVEQEPALPGTEASAPLALTPSATATKPPPSHAAAAKPNRTAKSTSLLKIVSC